MTHETSGVNDKPSDFPMSIQGGMLEALGINMYTTLGKCLVEFVANAYDSEASNVNIAIPTGEIDAARAAIRDAARSEVKAGKRDPFTVLLTPLPEGLTVVIEDDGHGMSPDDIENKFLPLNRKRRADSNGQEKVLTSENGRRHVMGRKGLGKLAGFGAAEEVTITTKRGGDTYATTIRMDYRTLGQSRNISEVRIPATYEEGLDANSHGTRIVLSRLKSDAVKHSIDTIITTIREAFFGIRPDDFSIRVNDELIEPDAAEYEFCYPEGAGPSDLASTVLHVPDVGDFKLSYFVGFRPRGQNLSASKRGARIYCNGRLAAGPSLFGLPTGMHNFHSQSYMECVVEADELDRHIVDFVNTNRTQLREDNEVVSALIRLVEEHMREALVAHGKFRDSLAEEQLDTLDETYFYRRVLDRMAPKTRTSARRLLKGLGTQYGVKSAEFFELAPLVIDAMNGGEVLIRLSELGHDPQSLARVADMLRDLAEIEKSDALKLYRGRRSGIRALMELIGRGEELWKKKGFEKELHTLLKNEPWLIKPEYSRYLTSDDNIEKVASSIAAHLKVDHFSPLVDESSAKRPDLVFAMSDSASPHIINIVELKSPSFPLDINHLTQLKGYMMQVEKFIRSELNRPVTVHGYLIGAMPDAEKMSYESELLLAEIRKSGPEADWMVLGLRDLFERAFTIHIDAIDALKKDLGDELQEVDFIDSAPIKAIEGPPQSVEDTVGNGL